MTFKQAFEQMKYNDERVKLPSWYGYWYWDDDKQTIMMKCKETQSDNGKDLLDIRETQRVEYTLMNILSDEWVIANEENCPLLGGVATFDFNTAMKYVKRGLSVKRKSGKSYVNPSCFSGGYIAFSLEDIEATDWMFVE